MRHPRLLTFAKVVAVRGSCELPRPRPPSTLDASNRLRYPRKYRKTAGQYPIPYLKFAPGAIGEPTTPGRSPLRVAACPDSGHSELPAGGPQPSNQTVAGGMITDRDGHATGAVVRARGGGRSLGR